MEDDALDIFIIFSEAYSGDIDMDEMESRARNVIEKYKKERYVRRSKGNPRSLRFIPEKVKKVLEEEFLDEAALIIVNDRVA